MADAVHTFRHISYSYEILSWCVALWYAWVSVLLGLYVNPAVTPLSAARDWYLGHVESTWKMMQSEAQTHQTSCVSHSAHYSSNACATLEENKCNVWLRYAMMWVKWIKHVKQNCVRQLKKLETEKANSVFPGSFMKPSNLSLPDQIAIAS